MMITRKLTDFTKIEMLYNTRMKKDFPRDEMKPLASIRQLWEKNAYECYALLDDNKQNGNQLDEDYNDAHLFNDDEIFGYAFFVRRDRDYLFDYFAIAEEHRNKGLGTLFLRQLEDCVQEANCVVGEVEDPDAAENDEIRVLRDRRLQFYLRSGYLETELTSTVFGVDFRILEIPTAIKHTTEELCAIYTELYRSTLPPEFFDTQFQVREGSYRHLNESRPLG